MNKFRLTQSNYSEFYRDNKNLVLFIEEGIGKLAHDMWDEDHINYEEAFDTIFDDIKGEGEFYMPENLSFVLSDPRIIEGLREYAERGLQETVEEIRSSQEPYDPLPIDLLINLHPSQRN